jgi:hypothetical protein
MSDERRYDESIRRRANRAQERLTATLEQSRIATARDKRTNQRRAARDSSEGLGRERRGSRSTERAGELGEDRQIGVQPNPIQSTDAKWRERPLVLEASELAPRDSDTLAARDGLRTLADGAKVEWRPGNTATRPRPPTYE